MRFSAAHAVFPIAFAFALGCGGDAPPGGGPDGGEDTQPDASSDVEFDAAPADAGVPDAGTSPDAAISPDAAPPPEFDHFGFSLDPASPRAAHPFELEIQAYASADDSEPLLSYEGPASVTASAGELSGDVDSQSFVDGAATLTLEFADAATDVELTVTDDADAEITGTTAPFDVRPEGDTAALREVVINEVNWFGNNSSGTDVWIELRNTTAEDLRLADWSIDNAGTGTDSVVLGSGTEIPAGSYLVVANRQGEDIEGERTSVTGVENGVVETVSLANSGEELILRDREAQIVDRTPEPTDSEWPAGNPGVDFLRSMERLDDLSGGGYGDGAQPEEWYTWNHADGTDTTHPETDDLGTPGADNSDVTATVPPDTLPYATSFEPGQRELGLTATTSAQVNDPPTGTFARSGSHVLSTADLTQSFGGRPLQSFDCIELRNDTDTLVNEVHGTASGGNGQDVRLRIVVEWYTDDQCEAFDSESRGDSVVLPEGEYGAVQHVIDGIDAINPAGVTHMKLRVEARRTESGSIEGWAADDLVSDQDDGL